MPGEYGSAPGVFFRGAAEKDFQHYGRITGRITAL
jgi:hypothetical protein